MFPKASEALDLLAEAAPVERFPSLRRDLAALYAGYYIAELLTDLTDLHDPHPKLFDAARITLRHLGDAELRSRRILRFELACLRELGLMPSLDQCAQCGGDVRPRGRCPSGSSSGGVLCEACRPGQPHVVSLSAGDLEAIRVLASPETTGASWTSAGDVTRRPERRSVRSSVTSWAIVPGSGPYWECDPMVRGDRNLRTAPGCVSAASPSIARFPVAGGAGRLAAHRRAIVALARPPSVRSAGCQSFISPLAQWRAAYDGNLVKGPSKERWPTSTGPTDSDQLFDRWITPRTKPHRPRTRQVVDADPGLRRLAAHRQAGQGPRGGSRIRGRPQAVRARKASPRPKRHSPRSPRTARARPWGEDGQYYLAETQFQRQKYVDAHDSFELLHNDYPATEYLDKLVSREFEIAQLWIAQDDPKAPKEKRIPWYGRFDGGFPFIDTQGYALKALEHVRHNDPIGPLADDAAIEIAEYYMKHNDFESAAIYYEQFIADYHKSPILREAQLAAIDARIKGYLGPDYDAAGLEKARAIIRKTMEDPTSATGQLRRALSHARRDQRGRGREDLQEGAYYKKIGKVASAEFYFGKIPRRWPNSPWAVKAKVELAQLAKMPRTPSKPSKIIIPPGSTDPFGGGGMGGGMGGMGGGMGGMGGMGMGMPMGGGMGPM